MGGSGMRRLGDILIEEGTLTAEQMEAAFDSRPREIMIGDWLVAQRLLSTAQLGHALAQQFGVPYVDSKKHRFHLFLSYSMILTNS